MAGNDMPNWEVVGQSPDVGDNGQGVFVKGVEVTYRTKSGAVGRVFFPQSEFTTDNVRAKLSEVAGHTEAIANLKG